VVRCFKAKLLFQFKTIKPLKLLSATFIRQYCLDQQDTADTGSERNLKRSGLAYNENNAVTVANILCLADKAGCWPSQPLTEKLSLEKGGHVTSLSLSFSFPPFLSACCS